MILKQLTPTIGSNLDNKLKQNRPTELLMRARWRQTRMVAVSVTLSHYQKWNAPRLEK